MRRERAPAHHALVVHHVAVPRHVAAATNKRTNMLYISLIRTFILLRIVIILQDIKVIRSEGEN